MSNMTAWSFLRAHLGVHMNGSIHQLETIQPHSSNAERT
jgi:hypothetical protein